MIKKIIILAFIIPIFIAFYNITNSAQCNYVWWGDISANLDSCLGWSKLVEAQWPQTVEEWFKDKILEWTTNIWTFLWLIAIWAIVFWSFMMVISTWEEEKIKKAKDMIKWSILWFLWIVLASSLIAIVVNFMYSL